MAAYEGTLDTDALRAIFQVLIGKNPVCTLLVSDGLDERAIYFSSGGIRVYASRGRRVADLGEDLVRRGLVNKEQLEIALGKVKSRRGGGLGDALVTMGILPAKLLQERMEDLVYQELCDLCVWEGPIYELYEGKPPPELHEADRATALSTSTDVPALIQRVRDWLDQWTQLRETLHCEEMRPKVLPTEVDLAASHKLSLHLGHLLTYINGERSLRELARDGNLPFPEVARAVDEGIRKGYLQAHAPQGETSAVVEDLTVEIERIEAGLEGAVSKVLLHRCILSRYERLGDIPRVAQHYEAIGNLQLKAGQFTKALDSYLRAIRVAPWSIATHKNFVRLLHHRGETDRAFGETLVLARRLVAFGLADYAVKYLRKAATRFPFRDDIRFYLADILIRIGRKGDAIDEYIDVARSKSRRGYLEGLEEVYRKILVLDPRNAFARTGLKREKARRVGGKTLWLYRISAAVVVLGIVGWLTTEGLARHAWANSKGRIENMITHGRVEHGLAELRRVVEVYPGTLLSGELVALDEQLFKEAFHTYQDRIEEAADLSAQGRCKEALDLLSRVVRNAPVESQRANAKNLFEHVQGFRNSWLKMRRRAEKLLNAGFRKEAFAICRQIIDNYPEGAQGLKIPLLIQSSTPGARVKIDGVLWGYTPLWIALEYGKDQEVQVVIPGSPAKVLRHLEERSVPYVDVDFRERQ